MTAKEAVVKRVGAAMNLPEVLISSGPPAGTKTPPEKNNTRSDSKDSRFSESVDAAERTSRNGSESAEAAETATPPDGRQNSDNPERKGGNPLTETESGSDTAQPNAEVPAAPATPANTPTTFSALALPSSPSPRSQETAGLTTVSANTAQEEQSVRTVSVPAQSKSLEQVQTGSDGNLLKAQPDTVRPGPSLATQPEIQTPATSSTNQPEAGANPIPQVRAEKVAVTAPTVPTIPTDRTFKGGDSNIRVRVSEAAASADSTVAHDQPKTAGLQSSAASVPPDARQQIVREVAPKERPVAAPTLTNDAQVNLDPQDADSIKIESGRADGKLSVLSELNGYRTLAQTTGPTSPTGAERSTPFVVSGSSITPGQQSAPTTTVSAVPIASAPMANEAVARSAVTQIAAALNTPSNARRIDLSLDPPELGRIEIQMEVAEAGMKAMLTAERHATGDMLRRQSDLLMQQLNDAGFESVDISFADFTDGQMFESGSGQPGTSGGETESAPSEPAPSERRQRITSNAMDMRL
ncbi:MAG: flagellar hook-length control protein FliK [Pseudomonadota bacterium]